MEMGNSMGNPASFESFQSELNRLVATFEKDFNMLALMPKLRAEMDESKKTTLQNAVDATDRQIDTLVYELYGLTEEEIWIRGGGGEVNRLEMLERIKERLPALALEYKDECTSAESLISRQLGDEQ